MQGIYNEVHYWINTQGQLLVSNEGTKKLQSFDSVDTAINFYYIKGNKGLARHLNSVKP